LHLEVYRSYVAQLIERRVVLYNGGQTYFKGRVGEKGVARCANRPIPQRHQDGDCQVKSGPIAQQTAMRVLINSRQEIYRACSGERIEFVTLYLLF
jgi:hypothetical protein